MTTDSTPGPAQLERSTEDHPLATPQTDHVMANTTSPQVELSNLDSTSGSGTTGLEGVRIPNAGLGSIDAPSNPTPAAAAAPIPAVTAAPTSEPAVSEAITASKDGAPGDATAIGPSSDDMTFHEPEAAGNTMMITLLLTNGARHPYKIDRKYLRKRNVNAVDNDPFNLSVYTLKELIWREWRDGQYLGPPYAPHRSNHYRLGTEALKPELNPTHPFWSSLGR